MARWELTHDEVRFRLYAIQPDGYPHQIGGGLHPSLAAYLVGLHNDELDAEELEHVSPAEAYEMLLLPESVWFNDVLSAGLEKVNADPPEDVSATVTDITHLFEYEKWMY
jgi:hypothetical protein